MMKEMKRILSLVLCLVMVLGMMPMVALNASAVEDTTGDDVASQDAPTLLAEGETDTGYGEYETGTGEAIPAYVPTNTPSGNVLIVAYDSEGNPIALNRNGEDLTPAAVTVLEDENGNSYIEKNSDVPSNAVWAVSGSYKFRSGNNYLRYDNGLKATKRDSINIWTYSNGVLSNGTNYLRYNGYDWTTGNSGNATPVYFFKEDTIPGEPVPEYGTYKITAITPLKAAVKDDTSKRDLDFVVTFTPDGGTAMEVDSFAVDCEYTWVEGDAQNPIISKVDDGTVYFTGNHGQAKVRIAYTLEDGSEIVTYVDVFADAPYYSLDLVDVQTREPIDTIIPVKGVEDGKTYSVWAVIKEFDGFTDEEHDETEDGVDQGDVEDGLINWESSDDEIATVDEHTGLITFHGKEGLVHITATYTGGLNADKNYPSDTVTFSATTTEYMVPSDGTNDFPIYHEPGAIRFDKTAEPVGNFSQTGVAQLELSMTGIPFSGKGTDVIIMLDTSSSMTKNTVTGTNKTRDEVLEEALADLLTQLKKQDANGNYMDINVAIADFNGYYGDGSGGSSKTPYDRTSGDYVKNGNSNGSGYNQPSEAKVYTGSKALNAEAFVHVSDLAASYTLNYTSGTNYDYAFDAIYQLGTAIKAENTEDRELIVIFMSDGASLQWNYFGTQNTYTKWNNWLAGTWKESDLTTTNLNSTAHSYFYDLNDHDNDGHINEHRMANAIKGSPDNRYEIIRKSTAGLPEGTLVSAGKDYLYTVPGLGATMYTINFDARDDGQITMANIDKALASTASDQTGDTQYYYKITTADQLNDAFKTIGEAITEAATDITVTDKITDEYTMIFGIPQSVGNDSAAAERNQAVANALANQDLYIEVINYNLDAQHERGRSDTLFRLYLEDSNGAEPGGFYSAAKDNNGTAADTLTFVAKGGSKMAYWSQVASDYKAGENDIVINVNGQNWKFIAKGNGTHNVASGAYAYGTIDETTNMSNDLVIITPYFAYSAKTRMLAWTVDKLEEFKEIALRYFLYLEESAADIATENETAAGPYPTNEWAYMTYTNHLGHLCRQEFPKPQMNWNGAQASYVFYLVNAQGQPVNKYGQVVDFVNATFVTDVFTEAVVWNRDGSEGVGELNPTYLASEKLPENYTLYDPDAKYMVHVYEDERGQNQHNYFTISGAEAGKIASHLNEELPNVGATADNVSVTTTKVYNTISGEKISGYGTYTSASNDMKNFNFSNTTVAFAVVWQVELVPDAVVVDYGLDVLINVVQNDFLQNTVSGLGKQDANLNGMKANVDHYNDPLFNSTMLEINGHTIKTEEGKENLIRFQQGNMTFDEAITFYYESPVKFYQDSSFTTQYMYSTVTVIPATTIYYEDSFLEFSSYDKSTGSWVKDTTSEWVQAPQTGTQAQDRPGASKISAALDADNNYGYDAAYQNMSTHSLGSAAKLTVDANTYGEVKFTFCGTGFDLISLTSGATGTMTVLVEDESGNPLRSTIVDTYYGMTADGVVSVNDPEIIYQVPVIEVFGLDYGKYTVTINAAWSKYFDHVEGSTSYDLYIDAVRIYDPTGNEDPTSMDAYVKDNEAFPVYTELRDKIIAASNYQVTENGDGSLTVTGDGSDAALQGGIFIDCNDGTTAIADYVSYGPNNELYLANNQAIAFNVNLPANVADVQLGIKVANGESVTYEINGESCTVSTATDMYYSILKYAKSGLITIKNVSGGILSLTNIKVTHKTAPEQQTADELLSMTPDTVRTALLSLRRMPVVEEEIPETTEPEIPETTVPEETEPEFEPTVKVKIKKTTVDEGKKVDVEIRTSDDVALITVNGMTVTKYKTDKKTGERTWTCSLKAEKAGDMEIEVIAYSADGDAAEPVSETVEVVGKPAKKGKGKK